MAFLKSDHEGRDNTVSQYKIAVILKLPCFKTETCVQSIQSL